MSKERSGWKAPAAPRRTGRFVFVPTLFRSVGGETFAALRTNGNSAYTVVRAERTPFRDLDGHWAQRDVERLAAKLLVAGRSAERFAPDEPISRSEWAALLARGLGLMPLRQPLPFADTPNDAWYAESLAAAAAAGLIEGEPDGRFRPDDPVTREQMAVTLVRARDFIGRAAAVETESEAIARLSDFADRADISAWAETAMAEAANAGWLRGTGGGMIAPKEQATRAQAALTLHRMLTSSGWMN